MALSTHHLTQTKGEVPARESINFPLQRGRCKKCNTTYWWGKMKMRGQFYPPFADSEARHWHVCGQKSVSVGISDDVAEELKDIVETVTKQKKSNAKKYSGRSIESLIADIQALSTTLKDYGRPHV